MEHLLDCNPDVIFLTETWLTSEKNNITAEVKNYGYELYHKIRKQREKDRGGGVGTLVKSDIKCKPIPSKEYHSFECCITRVPLKNNKYLLLIVVYRLQFVPIAEFIEEFNELLETFTVLYEDFIIAGDVNIHVETDECAARKFNELIELYDLKQHVVGPTHIAGHTIDVVVSPNRNYYVTDVNIRKIEPIHHFLIEFKVSATAVSSSTKVITYRDLKNIDSAAFNKELSERLQARQKTEDMVEKVSEYNSIVTGLLNKHAPIKQKAIKIVPTAPWFDSEYRSLRKQRRKAEKKYRKNKLPEDKAIYTQLRKATTDVAREKKRSHVSQKIAQGSTKSLYSMVNKLIDNTKEAVLPTAESDVDLANKFLLFFKQKIEKIRAKFPSGKTGSEDVSTPNPNIEKLSAFSPTTEEELRMIITKFGMKCSPEDPLPATILSSYLDTLLPVWMDIVNLSMSIGSMASLKSAVILPLIKELTSSTDIDNFKNYRPVSNLLFISKLIERVVDIRLQEHLDRNNLSHGKQYGYKKRHSTEMLLTKVINGLLESCDRNIPSIVLLLDLSAAFDTVDHEKLLEILYRDIGITGVALEWFRSFLKDRMQKVKVGDAFSEVMELLFGVAQGSILGPRLFNIYIRSLYKYVESTGFDIEGFADDHQLVKQFVLALQPTALGDDICNCLNTISIWMKEHFLCLNDNKTKILVIAPPAIKEQILINGVNLENSCIRFVDSAKNLGVIIDSTLSFESQIDKVVKTCFNTIRKLSKIKVFLSPQHLQTLVSSLIFSNLDYCNSLYFGLPESSIQKLQRVQNCAARLVTGTPFRQSLDGVFIELHWLKVKLRIIYKILLVVHNCLNDNAPNAIAALLRYSESERTMKLKEIGFHNSYGARAFSRVAPKLWNLLPEYLRNNHDTLEFKKKLKSFLLIRGEEFICWTKIK